jgi:hypothetical protein
MLAHDKSASIFRQPPDASREAENVELSQTPQNERNKYVDGRVTVCYKVKKMSV